MVKNKANKFTNYPPINVENLTVWYGANLALSNINIKINPGEFLGLIGPNGGGKSTLLKTILGLIKPFSGEVSIFGYQPGKIKSLIGYIPQIISLNRNFPASVKDVVLMAKLPGKLIPFHRYTKKDKEEVNSLLNKLGIYHIKDKQISQISGGEFQKTLIARALATEPSILILDEPSASIDAKSKNQIYELLNELKGDKTIILVTHELSKIFYYTTTIACLNKTLVYYGEPALNETITKELYGYPVKFGAKKISRRQVT